MNEKVAAARQLCELIDQRGNINLIIQVICQQSDDLPVKAREICERTLVGAVDQLLDVFVEMYIKYFELSELQAMVTFFASPSGRKWTELTPVLMQEGMEAAQEWASPLIASCQEEYEALED